MIGCNKKKIVHYFTENKFHINLKTNFQLVQLNPKTNFQLVQVPNSLQSLSTKSAISQKLKIAQLIKAYINPFQNIAHHLGYHYLKYSNNFDHSSKSENAFFIRSSTLLSFMQRVGGGGQHILIGTGPKIKFTRTLSQSTKCRR